MEGTDSSAEVVECSTLRKQIVDDNAFFKKMVALIPARYTIDETTNSQPKTKKPKKIAGRKGKQAAEQHDILQTSLKKKLEELRAKRLKPGAVIDSAEVKRLKRKLSKQKRRQKLRAQKQSKAADGDSKPINGKTDKSAVKAKPIFNKDGKMVFSKFDFSDGTTHKDSRKADVPTGKNYKALLQRAEKKKEKISKLATTDEDKAREVSRKEMWKSALSKAEGVKVRDNPELLKKALKKHEKKKEHSRTTWKAREEHVAKQMQDRQDKRARNISKKKDGRANKKLKKAQKQGRVSRH